MRFKSTTLLIGAMVLALILLTGTSPAMAATKPAGEVKLVQAQWGHEIPIPRFELTHANDWMNLMYDHLCGTNADGTLSTKNGIAEKWTLSPDGLTWTFYLRKGVKFHDGSDLTAEDVKFSLDQIMLKDSTTGYVQAVRRAVKSMEIKDPYTLVIQCKKPSIFLNDVLGSSAGTVGIVLPKNYYEKIGMEQFQKKPMGSGPYKWIGQQVGSYIKLEATGKDHYRDGVGRFKYMTYLIIPEEGTRISMLMTGEADISRVSRERKKEVLAAGLQIITKEGAGAVVVHGLEQWHKDSPFNDVKFRKALNLAIDRDSIIKHIYGGGATPLPQFPGQNVYVCGGDPNLPIYPYNPEEAKKLIKEGGWEGFKFTLVSYPRSAVPEYPRMIETIGGYWKKIGLKPKIMMSEYVSARKQWRGHTAKNWVLGYDTTNTPSCASMLRRLAQKYLSNESRTIVKDPKLDAWFKKAMSSVNPAEVAEIVGKVYKYSYDQHLMVPICHVNDEVAASKKIPRWDPGRRRNDRNYNAIIRTK